jgi:hypothetical protein
MTNDNAGVTDVEKGRNNEDTVKTDTVKSATAIPAAASVPTTDPNIGLSEADVVKLRERTL